MGKFMPSSEQIARLVASIPEGFIREASYAKLFQTYNKGKRNLSQAAREGKVGLAGTLIYDATRIDEATARALAHWCDPALPPLDSRGMVLTPPIVERRAIRAMVFASDPDALALIDRIGETGYITQAALHGEADESLTLARLLIAGALTQKKDYIYDPLRISESTIDAIVYREALVPTSQEMLAVIGDAPAQTVSLTDMQQRYGRMLSDLVAMGGVVRYQPEGVDHAWVRLESADPVAAEAAARRAVRKQKIEARKHLDGAWERLLPILGDRLRPDTEDGKSNPAKVAARSYTLETASRRLSVRDEVLMRAIRAGLLTPFIDPKGKERLSAAQVEAAYDDPALGEAIAAPEVLNARGIALVSGASYATARGRLVRMKISTTAPTWGEVRGKWDLPDRYRDYRALLKVRKVEWRAEQQKRYEAMLEKVRLQQEEEVRRREDLRLQLLAIFPTWEMVDRSRQEVVLHIGPTNSGKTHDALTRLSEAGSGWYLAPLRLLAFEIFDRLNARGVPCTLLTGEEYIPMPGAQITAATIEMFNPHHSGECVIIDEAHMLADPDRGAAWTRALLEAQAPEVHVLGAPIVRPLIERLTHAVSLPLTVREHTRLTPIRVAEQPWTLRELPARTILIAFSRKMVLGLKMELEKYGRTVAVVYGNLPPEVRRRQSDRFAAEACEICVATDAVGMGLNLPADNVCFFDIEKYDGKQMRLLHVHEVQQIGGRAGRYGLSQEGIVGALNWDNLKKLKMLYEAQAQPLTRAHVAPSVEAITLIPGTLAERLQEWSSLQSIPDALRSSLQTADMTERIELAAMLRNHEVQQLGLAAALKLINAPTRQETREYWRHCATAILHGTPLPTPTLPPLEVRTHAELDMIEGCILEADIYLWLGSRQEFHRSAEREVEVRKARIEWSMQVDEALLRKIDTARRCVQCGNKLPLEHRFSLCESCYQSRWERNSRRPARRWR
ncbi:MAG: helicase-related protein [Chloroflexota bacterium]|nr:helicase-related protein [Chloroflexota bacterium]